MHAEPVAFAVFHDGWIEESTADRNRAEQWAEDGREVVLLYTATPAAEQPYSTTSDKYRTELYDEVWQKARDMGYGNVTEALIALEHMKAAEQPDTVRVPRELLRMAWRLIPSADGMTEAQNAEHTAWHIAASALLGKDGE
jgi:hypothetical protein